jgi:uncharacterized coiled-coil DUF342 family protein
MPNASKINSLRRKRDRHLGKIQMITEGIDDYEQSGSHIVDALKTYKEGLVDEWGRLQLIYEELNDLDDEEDGNERATYKNYLALSTRLTTLMKSEQLVNSSKPTSSEAPAITVYLLEIRLPTFDGVIKN